MSKNTHCIIFSLLMVIYATFSILTRLENEALYKTCRQIINPQTIYISK
jgi:hypothetical protein